MGATVPGGRPAPSGAILQELRLDASSRLDVLREVARAAARAGCCDAVEVASALELRERQSATVVARGLALPHAEVEGLRAPLALDVRLEHPVPWGGDDVASVGRCVVLLLPRGRDTRRLELLADAVRRLSDG